MRLEIETAPNRAVTALQKGVERTGPPSEELRVSPLIPVYFLRSSTVDPLSETEMVGWRSLVFQDDKPIAVAEVASAEGDWKFLQLIEGPDVHHAVEAVEQVKHEFDYLDVPLYLRFLESPELQLASVWLHGTNTDIYVPLNDGIEDLRALKPCARPVFRDAISNAVAHLKSGDSAFPSVSRASFNAGAYFKASV